MSHISSGNYRDLPQASFLLVSCRKGSGKYRVRTTNLSQGVICYGTPSDKGKMTRAEAGRLGGQATSKKHSRAFYQGIGRKGGVTTAETHTTEFYQEIGRKGGEATAESRDREFYQEIGRKGGKK